MEIIGGEIRYNELSKNAMGGSELMMHKIATIDPKLLKEAQIISTRVRELDPDKIRILTIHDLPGDPECEHLRDGGWKRFHKIVFVSNWQMQQFIGYYGLPWESCCVMHNAIEPISRPDDFEQEEDVTRVIYHTTPHRGLDVLYHAWERIQADYPKARLSVFSSFNVYGWPQRDEPYKELFEKIEQNPSCTYFGAQSNKVVREHLGYTHIFAYPSTWMETSCISLIEAMSAGALCVHPNLGALYETAGDYTMMYQWSPDKEIHSKIFEEKLRNTLDIFEKHDRSAVIDMFSAQRKRVELYYNWNGRKSEWEELIKSLKDLPREIPKSEPMFVYRT
jgi:UDP-glucose:(glucosyl)LPS alpha-1,2-glucosyltransferase